MNITTKMHRRRLLPLYRLQVFERYAFYGFKSIFSVLLLTLNFSNNQIIQITHLVFGFGALFPFLSSIFSDVVFGRYRALLHIIPLYLIVAICMGLFYQIKWFFFIGAMLMFFSSSLIKSTLPSFIIDQNKDFGDYDKKIVGSFVKHTMSANFGMFLGILTMPIIMKEFAINKVFIIISCSLFIALLLFFSNRRKYFKIKRKSYYEFFTFFRSIKIYSTTNRISWCRIFIFIMLVGVFYFVLEQKYSIWILQGMKLNKVIFGYDLPPNIMLTCMPAMSMGMIYLYDKFIFNLLKKYNIAKTLVERILFGMIIASLCPLSMALIEYYISKGFKLHLFIQIIPYFLLGLADVCVYLSGIQYIYTTSSPEYRSVIGSLWYTVTLFGNLYVGIFAKIVNFHTHGVIFFICTAGIVLIGALLFKLFVVNKQ